MSSMPPPTVISFPSSAPSLQRARRRPRWLAGLALLSLLACAIVALATGAFYGSLPSVQDAPARVRAIQGRAGRQPVFVSIPRSAKIARAIVAVEDERFYQHGAVDPLSIARAVRTSLTNSADPGGSTITQQLAKVLYVSHPATFLGRLRAVGLAIKLEDRFSKAQILSMYLNAIYFGHGFYGIAAASRGYFGKPFDALSWGQAALLAGLPQSPSAFDPLRYPARAQTREVEVLAQLVDNRALTARAARAIVHATVRSAGPHDKLAP